MEEYKLYYAQVRVFMLDLDIGPGIPESFYTEQRHYRKRKIGNIFWKPQFWTMNVIVWKAWWTLTEFA